MTTSQLAQRLEACGIPFAPSLPGQLLHYHALLMDWNTRMDLTAVTDEAEMVDRHYVDSLMPRRTPGLLPASGRLIDVGTGAGFPGLPLALACPDMQVTLMDAQQKRLTFLQAVVEELDIRNVTLVHRRAEDAARDAAFREQFDLAVARAVAPLAVLAEYLLPFVRQGGKALCWKGPGLAEELPQGRRAAFLLGGQAGEPVACPFPGREWQHMLLPIQKTGKTARQYPRKAGTPSKAPLGAGDKVRPASAK